MRRPRPGLKATLGAVPNGECINCREPISLGNVGRPGFTCGRVPCLRAKNRLKMRDWYSTRPQGRFAKADLLLAAILAAAVSGCWPSRHEDCTTTGGLLVANATCESVQPMQERIEAFAATVPGLGTSLRGNLLWVRREEVDEYGCWWSDFHGQRVCCVVHCDMGTLIVGVGPKTPAWSDTAFAHAAAHALENCATDPSFHPQDTPYAHPQWDVRIHPFLRDVNSVEFEVGP